MKTTHLLLAAAFAFALPLSVHAAKDPAKKDASREERKATRQAVASYDKNGNGTIDADEADALKKAFEAEKTGPLKKLDTNADGKLDDTEIGAIQAGKKGGKGGKKKNK